MTMKKIFLEARYTGEVKIPKDAAGMPDKIGLFTTTQYIGSVKDIKSQLQAMGKSVRLFKARHVKYAGQILGCSIEEFLGIDALLFVGDGVFHPIGLAVKNNLPVYTFNPKTGTMGRINDAMKRKYQKARDYAIKRYYMSEDVGILVSLKPGQLALKKALGLKKKLDKRCYVILSDNIDFERLENFNFIDCYINTACPRISYDDYRRMGKPILHVEDIQEAR
jgi:2-(3-amino-3-carboxypropyl)histidine synthase